VQFGHGAPGTSVRYRNALLNTFLADTPADLHGHSRGGWPINVVPEHVVLHPNVPQPVTSTVGIPLSPTVGYDIERIVAVGGAIPVTATAHLITLAHRHPFTDVPAGYWADDPLQFLVAEGVVSGYADGTFRPEATVTRVQFAKMVVEAMEWQVQFSSQPTFSDVPASHWAYGYVETASARGVIAGYADGTFRPDAPITRAQAAKMIATARDWAMEPPEVNSFLDVSADNWAYNYAEMVYAADVMSGYADRTFRPYNTATRAQIAKILAHALFSDPNN